MQPVQELLRVTLSYSNGFQLFCGTGNRVEALGRVYHDGLPHPTSDAYTVTELLALRPCALISTELFTTTKLATLEGGTDCWTDSGQLRVSFFRTVPTSIANDLAAADTTMRVLIDAVIADLRAMSETAGRLASTHIQATQPQRIAEEEVKDYGDEQRMDIMITWGSQPR